VRDGGRVFVHFTETAATGEHQSRSRQQGGAFEVELFHGMILLI
jgi:hypothetical protein